MTNSSIRLFALPLTRASETDTRNKKKTALPLLITHGVLLVYSVLCIGRIGYRVKGIRHTHFAEFQIEFLEYCVMLLPAFDGM